MADFKDNIFRKIKRWWRFDAKYTHKYIMFGVKNLIKWFPIVWKDRDWDGHYIFEIMKFKIKKQSEYIGGRNIHTRAKRDAEIMMTCVRLMDKVQQEYYATEYIDYQKSNLDFVPIPNTGYYELKSELLEENFSDYFKKYPRIHKMVLKMDNPIFKNSNSSGIAMNISHINHKRAKKLLFKLMEENIEKWWD